MTYRRNEAIENGFERATAYLIPKTASEKQRQELRNYIDNLTVRLGPVVDSYPSWHPLVCNHNSQASYTYPNEQCGYQGLDHIVCFANGFISCPYQDGQKIIDSVNLLSNSEKYSRYGHVASIEAERIGKPLYNESTEPILVYVKWLKPINLDKTVPKNIAVGLMLEEEVPCWRHSKYGETWDTMRPYLMGQPCGKRSSIFLDQEAGQTMKKVYEAITYSGMFGPLQV